MHDPENCVTDNSASVTSNRVLSLYFERGEPCSIVLAALVSGRTYLTQGSVLLLLEHGRHFGDHAPDLLFGPLHLG